MEQSVRVIMMRYKHKGVTLAATAIAIVAWMFLGYISFIVMASPFSVLAAVRTARQAEQYAEFVANSLKLVDYSELGTAAHARRSLTGEISGAAGWESRVAIGAEQQIGSNPDNLQRIATIDIFQTGDTLSRYTLQVPLSSAGSSSAEGGDNLPVGTILPFTVYNDKLASIPEKWAICNGSNGTPDLTGRFLEGVTSSPGGTKSAGLPNITGRIEHGYVLTQKDSCAVNGALYVNRTQHTMLTSSSGTGQTMMFSGTYFDAHKSNTIYSDSCSTVQPASYTVIYIIKIKA